MTGTVHLGSGLVTGIIIGSIWTGGETNQTLAFATVCAVGSILPDIDSKYSKVSRKAPLFSFFARRIFGHRGVIHTPFFLLILESALFTVAILTSLPLYLPIGLGIGYLIHLLQDSMTRSGIMWIYPLTKRKFYMVGIRSGKSIFLESILSLLLIIPLCAVITGIFLFFF